MGVFDFIFGSNNNFHSDIDTESNREVLNEICENKCDIYFPDKPSDIYRINHYLEQENTLNENDYSVFFNTPYDDLVFDIPEEFF
jgi:aspartyl/asparaginyl beta-hydroxylase (cupin superfamily)